MGAKILVIEDDADIRRSMKKLLELEGYHVEVAENGRVALDLLGVAKDLPNVIILDLSMPVMDGFQFRAEQQKDPRLSPIPVAIMTADGHIEDKRIRTSANAALRKPADIDEILKIVEQLR